VSIDPRVGTNTGDLAGVYTRINDLERLVRSNMATLIGNNTITGVEINNGSILAANIGANQIAAVHMQANSINAASIQAGVIDAGHLGVNSVTAVAIVADAINSGHLQSGSVGANEIQAGIIDATHIATGTITATHIQVGSLTGDRFNTTSLNAAIIAAGAITTASITTGSLDTAVITGATIRTSASNPRVVIGSGIVTTSGTYTGLVGTDASGAVTLLLDAVAGTAKFKGGILPNSDGLGNLDGVTPNAVLMVGGKLLTDNPHLDSATITSFFSSASVVLTRDTTNYFTPGAGLTATTNAAGTSYFGPGVAGGGRPAVTAGLPYSFGVTVRTATARSVTVNIGWYNSGGGVISTSSVPLTTLPGQWKRLNLENVTAPVGAVTAAPYVMWTSAGSGEVFYSDNYVFVQRSTASGGVIVADSITAAEIQAGTITATQIATGTITAGLIAAGTITADKIGFGIGGSNLLLDSSFEMSALATLGSAGWTNSGAAGLVRAASTYNAIVVKGIAPVDGKYMEVKYVSGTDPYVNYAFPAADLAQFAGKKVTVSAYYYRPANAPTPVATNRYILVYDGLVSAVADFASHGALAAGAWIRVSVTLQVSAAPTQFTVRLHPP
jgi:hypothetical protein